MQRRVIIFFNYARDAKGIEKVLAELWPTYQTDIGRDLALSVLDCTSNLWRTENFLYKYIAASSFIWICLVGIIINKVMT
jgi:hypothetical protein